MAEPNRKLAAILSADVVGFSRLMQDDDAATVTTLREYRSAIGRVIDRHKGRVVNAPGDNILAEFPSAVESVQCACEIQQVLKGRNLELAPERRMEFRIGVNLGDVIEEEDGTIYGDGVNIAARMEALADAGGICIASSIYDAVEGKLDFGFDFLGEQQVKNIAKPVQVYRVRAERSAAATPAKSGGVKAGLIAAAGFCRTFARTARARLTPGAPNERRLFGLRLFLHFVPEIAERRALHDRLSPRQFQVLVVPGREVEVPSAGEDETQVLHPEVPVHLGVAAARDVVVIPLLIHLQHVDLKRVVRRPCALARDIGRDVVSTRLLTEGSALVLCDLLDHSLGNPVGLLLAKLVLEGANHRAEHHGLDASPYEHRHRVDIGFSERSGRLRHVDAPVLGFYLSSM